MLESLSLTRGMTLTNFPSNSSYPYGQTQDFATLSVADQTLLDTNNNGVLDAGDDAFSPYYPGDDVVDWIGLSICTLKCLYSRFFPIRC